jgi:hypothetical protein
MRHSHWLIATATLLLPGCSDRHTLPTETPPPAAAPALAAWECRADVGVRAVRCAVPTGSDARALIMGGQNLNVKLTTLAVSFDSATGVFSADQAIENLLNQALGTPDGVSTDPEGIRVFFHDGPVVTAGSGHAAVANPDGTGTFTAAGQPFFRYPGMLAPHAVTAAKTWRFQLDPGVVRFAFHVFLDVRVEPRLVIDEIMAHPVTASEPAGEWFEVYNSGRVRIDLGGYTIASGGDAGYTISGSLVLLSGEYAVLGGSADHVANGGVPVHQAYTGVTLGNDDADWLALRTPTGIAVDSVSWGAAAGDLPAPPGLGAARALMALDSANVSLSGAHSPWKDAVGIYGPGLQRGTPGKANLRGAHGGISIGAGREHTCMADRDGIAWCWGLGPTQLGTSLPKYSSYSTPTRQRVAAPAGVRFGSVALSGAASCALSFLGEVYCWGWVPFDFAVITSTPTEVPNPTAARPVSLAAGVTADYAPVSICEIDPAGAAYCYGGSIGSFRWVALSTLSTVPLQVTQMALGAGFACALAGGRVYCHGNNWWGELGDSTHNTPSHQLVETRLPPGVTFRWVAAAGATACALSDAGQAYCWGRNQSGQMGNGTASPYQSSVPVPVPVQQPVGVTFTSLAMGEFQERAVTCGLTAAGQAYCWGQNDSGRVGDGTEERRLVPTAVSQRGVVFSAITVGGRHTCALEAGTGQPFCWGFNGSGQLGEGIYSGKRLLPVPVVQ